MTLTAAELIQTLGLEAHPEGGHFGETFRAPPLPFELPGRGARAASTAIYFLLEAGEFSAFHRVRSVEVWHHYLGSPLELHTLDERSGHLVTRLGPNVASGERPQAVVPADVLQAARLTGKGFALCGCTVAPGFDFADFELPERSTLVRRFPEQERLIASLTRGQAARR